MEYIIDTYEYMEEEGIHARLPLKFSGKIIQIFRSGKLNIAMEAMAHLVTSHGFPNITSRGLFLSR